MTVIFVPSIFKKKAFCKTDLTVRVRGNSRLQSITGLPNTTQPVARHISPQVKWRFQAMALSSSCWSSCISSSSSGEHASMTFTSRLLNAR